MNHTDILKRIDHTLLRPDATWGQIQTLCDEGIRWRTASVCIPPSFVRQASDFASGKVPICTVIGFPTGYSVTAAKITETERAITDGADEIDMVINIGWLKDKRYEDIAREIKEIKAVCGEKILKVIIETCLLTDDEKIEMCRIISETGADFIKTSTGFSSGGATLHDIRLFKANVAPHVRIKAAGGVKTVEDAIQFIEAGADRLGTSSLARLLMDNNR